MLQTIPIPPTLLHHSRVLLLILVSHEGPIFLDTWYEPVIDSDYDSDDDEEAKYHEVPLNLLLTCKAIHKDLVSTLFSTNQIFGYSCKTLQTLSPFAIQSMKYLTLVLFVQRTECSVNCCFDLEGMPGNSELPPYNKNDTNAIMNEWFSTAHYLFDRISPRQLDFSLIFETENEAQALQVLSPLSYGPTLRHCSLRLGSKNFPSHIPTSKRIITRSKMETVALKAVGNCHLLERPYLFFNLPLEVQMMVMSYTDLVSPAKQVEWDPQDKFFRQFPYSEHQPCSVPHFNDYRCDECKDHGNFDGCQFQNHGEIVCFCRFEHIAYSTKNPSLCQCWSPPKSLFLVSHRFRYNAQIVFFHQNSFAIGSNLGDSGREYHQRVIHTIESVIIRFLTKVVPNHCLTYLQKLNIIHLAPENQYLRPLSFIAGTEELEATLKTVKKNLHLPWLRIAVYIEDGIFGGCGLQAHFECQPFDESLQNMYETFCSAFAVLRGLGSFSVHLMWPIPWK